MDAYEVLVIILSVMLAIFLLLAIAATIVILTIFIKFKKVAKSAERVAQNVEDFSSSMMDARGPINFMGAIFNLFKDGKSR
jgi:tellurite resistance protein TehA-like permease